MPTIDVNGDLQARLEKLMIGQTGPLWLDVGVLQTLTFSLGFPFSGGLSGRNLVAQTTGNQAVTGSFYFASLIELASNDMNPLSVRDFTLNATDLLTLVSREPGRMLVVFQADAFADALSAEAWGITGKAGADRIAPSVWLALKGADTISADDGNDTVDGGQGRDVISGGRGNDRLLGNYGADRLSSGAGADKLFGGQGADFLDGGGWADTLSGGAGADVFHFTATGGGADRITDFQDGVDRLSVTIPYTLSETRAGTVVSYDGGSVLILGVPLVQITDQDFL